MIRISVLVCLVLYTSACSTPQKSSDGNLHIVTVKNTKAPRKVKDTTTYLGVESIPITGRSEGGTLAALEGTWVLTILNDTVLSGASELHTGKMTSSTERQSDTITTATLEAGGIRTSTTKNTRSNQATEKKITPGQGSNYHIPERPSLSFFGSNETFTGFTGCNRMGGRFVVTGNKNISFRNAAPATRMVCIGDYNETSFLETLQKVNTFKRTGETLQLLQGDKVLLQFVKN